MFSGCSSLTSVIEGSADNINMVAKDRCLMDRMYKDCTSLESIDKVWLSTDMSYVFEGCTSLKSVSFIRNGGSV